MGCSAGGELPPLFLLIEEGKDHKVRDMIRNNPGAAASIKNSHGDTALHHAASKAPDGKSACLKALLEAPGLDINATNKVGFTPLHFAMGAGMEECSRELLRANAKPDIAEPGEGNTCIHLAVINDQPKCLQAAVDCNTCTTKKNKGTMTPLHVAAAQGRLACVEVLVTSQDAKLDEPSDFQNTPLHEAAIAGHREVAEALLKANADRHATNGDRKTPGQVAAASGHARLAEILGAAPKEEDIAAGKVVVAAGGGHFVEGDPEGLFPTGDETCQRVQELMDQTWKDVQTRDRHSGQVGHFEVVQVLQNSSKALWEKYQGAREDIVRSYVAELSDVKTVVEAFEQGLQEPRDEKANEFFLFHGSKPQALTKICGSGFNMDLSGSNRGSLYGPGIYCAESSAKADEYAEDDKDGLYKGLYGMLLCRVCLGNPIITEDETPDIEELQRRLSTTDMHSIVGDREKARGTFREFILCNADQVYPAYAVIYKRKES